MPVLTNIRETISIRQAEEQERYQLDRLRTDEITQASEQLNGAMKNAFEYERGSDGELYFQGQSLREVFVGGINKAEEIVKLYPQFGIELYRRHIELRQYEAQVTLAGMPESDDPLVLVHVSPTPDSVLSGEVNLNAYDIERKKIMVRVSEKTTEGIRVTSFSLDGNNRLGLQAIADMFGEEIADSMNSEDILAKNFLGEKSRFGSESPTTALRKRYDAAMAMQYGGEWYAGRQDSEVLHTIEMINRFPSIVNEHVSLVADIRRRHRKTFRETPEYETANYNFLAAIQQANQLGEVVGSLGDAGDIARAEGTTFSDPDCPTGVAQNAQEALAQQGIGERIGDHIDTCMQCPLCKKTGVLVSGVNGKVFYTCINPSGCGATTLPKYLQKKSLEKDIKPSVVQKKSDYTKYSNGEKQVAMREKYGRHATFKQKIGTGTAKLTIVNALTGEDLLLDMKTLSADSMR